MPDRIAEALGASKPVEEALAWSMSERAALKRAVWECAVAAGADTDGDTGPEHITDVAAWALGEVRALREAYDECPAPEDLERWRSWALDAKKALQATAGELHLRSTGHFGMLRDCHEPGCVAVAHLLASFPSVRVADSALTKATQ